MRDFLILFHLTDESALIHVVVQGKEKWCFVCDKTFESKNDHVNNDLRHNILVDNKNITESSGDMIDGYYYNDQDYYEFENDENENEAEEIESPFDDYMIFTIKKNIMKAYKVLYV
ncbi:unnamed protein product [Rhizophagus irregularis]|nr:unnamed protein product [Rhizophagus irregularis]CAB5324299.1 unnamed protein product [Rhizophagus irregularis]